VSDLRTLTREELRLALLDRQLLLARHAMTIEAALERVAGLQTQYAPSGYIGLWTRLSGTRRDDLTRALEERRAVQATLMRSTIHLVSARDYWPMTLAIREARRAWALRVMAPERDPATLTDRAERLRVALSGGPRWVKELDGLADGFIGELGVWLDLVRVPPSGTWERRRADRLALAEQWLGSPVGDEAGGLARLVAAYLGAFGPAPWRDIASWSGLPVAHIRRAEGSLDLVRDRGGGIRELVDLAGAVIPEPGVPIPVRFLPHWDATLLVHARRTGLLPEVHRPRVFSTRLPFSVGALLVGGRVVAGWSLRDGHVVVEPYEPIDPGALKDIEAERTALEAFVA
jgi:hypothetical protein